MEPQFYIFKDCLAQQIIARSPADASAETADLDDFVTFLASEVWSHLPSALCSATYDTRATCPDLDTLPLDHTPPSVTDTLVAYGLARDWDDDVETLLRRTLAAYVAEACAPPPIWAATRTTECEICARAVPLTYHHLIPRSMHAKVLKRKWHPESMINAVAWLCRPCHTAVHRVARTEELAREFYTVEKLLERDDIQKWRLYAAKQRWGVKRG
ncbi:hypothetical protein FA95DRAFT_1601497 [Auriscalpium vulgare]|uniref:Uncharacterized protein n=1 Tax=Auriscalpium vulgare TaxID=40419 RepID=A0ACB8S9J1_9AGAM|nr:hypothetical protein FA95DRAFT_1601497 [Auriscalpium vulgare]